MSGETARTPVAPGAPPEADHRAAPAGRRARAAHLGPERRRPLVLDAALRLFVEHGYRGTSMEAVAEAAGVTKPVVYECYPSKEALFRALLEREEARLLADVAAAFPDEPGFDDVEAVLASAFSAFLSAAAAAPDSWRVVFDSEHGSEPEVARRVRRAREAFVGRLGGLIQTYLAGTGTEEPGRKAPVLAELLASTAEASARVLLVSGGEWEPEELGRLVARVATRGAGAA